MARKRVRRLPNTGKILETSLGDTEVVISGKKKLKVR